MTRIVTLAALALPGAAAAHGDHAAVPEIAHGMAHAGPLLGLALIALAGAVALWRARE